MRTAEYWQNAALLREIAVQEGATLTAKDILRLYDEALGDINREIKNIKANYQKRYGLNESEAAHFLTQAQQDENLKNLIYALEQAPNEKARRDILEYIQSDGLSVRAYAARTERYKAVEDVIYSRIKKLAAAEIIGLSDMLRSAYKESYYGLMDDTAKGLDIGINFAILNDNAIDEAVSAKWHGKRFSERIWSNTDRLAQEAQELVTKSLMSGESLSKTSKKLADSFGVSKYRATTLIHTETAHVHAMADMKAYKDLGAKEYKYLATLDYKTCETCQPLDGKVFKLSEAREGVNYPVMHPRCRCTTTINMDYTNRRARNPLTGKNEIVNGDITYKDWINSLTPEQGQALEVSRKKDNMRIADKVIFDKYSQIYGKEFPKSFDLFQDLKYNKSSEWEAFKAGKQDRLNIMNFENMSGLVGKLGNKEVRLWYKAHDENIPNLIDKSKNLEQQARQACNLRNNYKFQARELMKDKKTRKYLDENESFKTFEDLVKHKKLRLKSYDDIYKDIIRSSTTTNKYYDEKAGLNL